MVGDRMTSGIPFRDTFWNIPVWGRIALYVGGAAAIAIFAYGTWQRIQGIRQGGPEARFDRISERLQLVVKHVLGQARVLTQAYPGIMHAVMFWGFLALFIGTVLATIDWDITLPLFGYKLLKGDFYLAYELVLDLFGLFFVIGLGMAVYRRFVVRPGRIDPTPHFAWVLTLLFVINLTGFIMEACRLAVVKPWWAPWSPVGYVLGQGMLALGMTEGALRATHLGVWLFHAVIALLFVAIVPYSYFVHLILTPLNVFFSKLARAGRSRPSPTSRRPRRRARWASPRSRSSPGSAAWTSRPAWSAAAVRTRAPPTCRGRRCRRSRSSSSSSATCTASFPVPSTAS